MGTIINTVKIMPQGLEINLNDLKKAVEHLLIKKNAKNIRFEEQPIAFGLKALVTQFDWPEEIDMDPLEQAIKEVKGVSSLDIIEQRRAF